MLIPNIQLASVAAWCLYVTVQPVNSQVIQGVDLDTIGPSDSRCSAQSPICEKGGSGTFVPGEYEYSWNKGGRIVLYALILTYLFAGVALLADAFMASIETITAREKVVSTVDLAGNPVQFSVRVWNPTVANLTLMALGSSAPEIILSIIEVIFNDFYAGDLGPGTIVGSAAFNLFIIIGICSAALGSTVKKIDSFGVFLITAFFAVFAYVWLIIILDLVSPNAIEIWEATVTLLYFPILVVIAYFLDKRASAAKVSPHDPAVVSIINDSTKDHSDVQQKALHQKIKQLRKQAMKSQTAPKSRAVDEDIDAAIVARIVQARGKKATRAYYRRLAKGNNHRRSVKVGYGVQNYVNVTAEISFRHQAYAVLHGVSPPAKIVHTVDIIRDGFLDHVVQVDYHTEDVTAVAGRDYEPLRGTVIFEKGEREKKIEVIVFSETETEQVVTPEIDDSFVIKIDRAFLAHTTDRADDDSEFGELVAIRNSETKVYLSNSTHQGFFNLECVQCDILESESTIAIKVLRIGGSKGQVSVDFTTKDGTALAGNDYTEAKGTLDFADGEVEKVVNIEIIDDDVYEKDEIFYLVISDPTGGATIGRVYETTIKIVNDDITSSRIDKLKAMLRFNEDIFEATKRSWKQQLVEALTQPQDGGILTWIRWVLMLPWHVLVALLPPPSLGMGWALFVMSLALTGVVTAFIGDYAALLGCCIGMSDYVTAITIVALGTSLPDTFASVLAAKHDSHADAAIINVTGSNSVNVFLGLGIAWMIGACYWHDNATAKWVTKVACQEKSVVRDFPDGVFFVKAGTLSFSVMIYSICAAISIGCILHSRKAVGGELGGPRAKLFLIIQISLWAIYIILSSLKSEEVL